jgi:hypothetical protein
MLVDMAFILAILERRTATRIVRVYGATTVDALALFDPALALTVPACSHVWAACLMAGNAIDREHLALIAANFYSLWLCHHRAPKRRVMPMAMAAHTNVDAK